MVFLDDDLVVQSDLSPLFEIEMNGKVNGAVETCHGGDKFVMSKRFKSYLNFSHPLISKNFDANECAWAYGMNIFDLEAWRKTNISENYHYWLEEVSDSTQIMNTHTHTRSKYLIFYISNAEFEIGSKFMAARNVTSRFDRVSWTCASYRSILAYVGPRLPGEFNHGRC